MSQPNHNLSDRRNPLSAFRLPHSRRGISIIEVMTAVVVAMIGVFGTMALIPFAVKQANAGLRLDEATNLARNSSQSFAAMGYQNENRFIFGVVNATGDVDRVITTDNFGVLSGSPVMVDPVWINANTLDRTGNDAVGIGVLPNTPPNFSFFGDGPDVDPEGGANPFRGQVFPSLPASLRSIRRVSVSVTERPVEGPTGTIVGRDPSPSLMSRQMAQRVFQSTDELVFSTFGTEEVDAATGSPLSGQPFQIFDRAIDGSILKRQANVGRISSAMFLVPHESAYRRYTLVFSDRVARLYPDPGAGRTAPNADPLAIMSSAIVTSRSGLGATNLPSGVTPAGGEVVLCPVDWSNTPPDPNQAFIDVKGSPAIPGVRRGDWTMMINQLPGKTVPQIQFYRIIGVNEGDKDLADSGNTVGLASLSLAGPAFDYGPPAAATDAGKVVTYIVHLRDVVNVFEDSVSL